MRKELLGGTKKLKKLFVRKKWPIRPGLQISHQLNFVCSTLKHVRRQPQKLNCLRKGPGRNFGEWLDDDFKMANKVFRHTIRRLRGKRSQAAFFTEGSNGVTLKDQDAILSRWREYFSDLLNPGGAEEAKSRGTGWGRYSDNRSRCECSYQIIENWKSTW